jgi:DNA polymerase III gamma/tau subunit
MINVLAAKFNQVDASIADTQSQITALQTKLSELQDYRQQLLSVEQACESALSQVNTALMMLHHVDPSQIDTFKTAVDAQFGVVGVGILESATVAPAEPTTPEPIAPTAPESPTAPDVEPAIDVEVEVADATVTDEPIAPTAPESPATDIETLLNKMSLADIRKLAKASPVKVTAEPGLKALL